MNLHSLRARAAAGGTVLVLTAAAAGPALAASSSDPVVAAIKAQGKALKSSGAIEGSLNAKTAAQARKDIPKLKHLAAALDHAAGVVAKVTPQNATEKEGQKDWVNGVHRIATAFDEIATAFQDFASGNTTAEKAEAAKGKASLTAGDALAAKAQKLLGY